jgi:hypothetical protein
MNTQRPNAADAATPVAQTFQSAVSPISKLAGCEGSAACGAGGGPAGFGTRATAGLETCATTVGQRPCDYFPFTAIQAFGIFLLLGALVLTGCVSKSSARGEVERAFQAGRQQGLREAETRGNNVFFLGQVQVPRIPWTEGLTLAQGIVAAHWTPPQEPRLILLKRGNDRLEITAEQLLSGEDVPLRPGDIVELLP